LELQRLPHLRVEHDVVMLAVQTPTHQPHGGKRKQDTSPKQHRNQSNSKQIKRTPADLQVLRKFSGVANVDIFYFSVAGQLVFV